MPSKKILYFFIKKKIHNTVNCFQLPDGKEALQTETKSVKCGRQTLPIIRRNIVMLTNPLLVELRDVFDASKKKIGSKI